MYGRYGRDSDRFPKDLVSFETDGVIGSMVGKRRNGQSRLKCRLRVGGRRG